MLRFVVAIPFIVHGLAHLGGLFASWTAGRAGFTDRPWLLSQGVTVGSPVGRAVSPLWLVAGIGLVAAGVGVISRQGWWPTVAVPAAAVSLAVILLWWRAVPVGAKLALVLNLVILLALLLPWKERVIDLVR
jgi:hypothetical protein